jgi:alkylglycerol monooxygenase
VDARWPTPAFDMAAVQRFDPPLSPRAALAAGVLFVVVLAGLGAFLWNVHMLSLAEQLVGSTALIAALWLIGSWTQPRPTPAPVKAPVPVRR